MGTTQNPNHYKDAIVVLIILTLIIIIFIPFDPIFENIPFMRRSRSSRFSTCTKPEKNCDIFSGKWVPYLEGPYYTNETQCVMDSRENCMKNGRRDMDFTKWRWKPDDCELPLFDGLKFLELVRGKSMAFVGDSLSRNQMQSLGCLLSSVAQYRTETNTNGENFISWYYPDYKFTLANFSSTHLVRAEDDAYGVPTELYLDEADKTWADHIEKFDYVIISSGHWFTKVLLYNQKGKIIGCNKCKKENMTDLNQYYGYRMALETAFKKLIGLKKFKGKVILRTISPTHFEVEKKEGVLYCPSTRPVTKEETDFDWLVGSYYMFQNEGFRVAKKEGKLRGLKFDLLDITDAMLLRPDGHPNGYGKSTNLENRTDYDCLHWCLPGPIDTWNEFLLHMLKLEEQGER